MAVQRTKQEPPTPSDPEHLPDPLNFGRRELPTARESALRDAKEVMGKYRKEMQDALNSVANGA